MLEQLFLDFLVTSGSETGILIMAIFLLYKKLDRQREASRKELAERVESVATRANGFFDVFLDSFDFPAWVKRAEISEDGNIELRMHFINRAYEKFFGKTRVSYIGKTDFDQWAKDVATKFYNHDLSVLGSKASETFVEDIGEGRLMEFKKFYVSYRDTHWVVGFAVPVLDTGQPQGITLNEVTDKEANDG
jgi:PAS domain-containing protein